MWDINDPNLLEVAMQFSISTLFQSVLSIACVACVSACSTTVSAPQTQFTASPEAIELAQSTIIFDGHVDYPSALINGDADPIDRNGEGDFDYVRAKAGGFNAPFMSIYVSAGHQKAGTAREFADNLIDAMEKVAADHPDEYAITTSTQEVREAAAAGKIAMSFGMENGAPIGEDIALLDHFFERGIRYITLTHSEPNAIADSSYSIDRPWDGLSPFGEEVVARMNELGMLVDISHVSDRAFYDALEITKAPVIASHSSLRHFTPGFERNMSDEMLLALKENGGVIMINYGTAFLTEEGNSWRNLRSTAYAAHLRKTGLTSSSDVYDAFIEEFMVENALQFATLEDVLDHIDRAVEIVGVDHVALGSDYDGVGDTLPIGLKHAGETPNLIQGLMDRGYSRDDIVKILSGNMFRVWERVEAIAGKHQSPIESLQ